MSRPVNPERQVIIDYIITRLRLAEDRATILAKTRKKWQTSTRVFDDMLKVSRQSLIQQQESLRIRLAELDAQMAIQARKKAIISAEERKEFLSKLVTTPTVAQYTGRSMSMCEVEVREGDGEDDIDEVKIIGIIPTELKIEAIKELNRMEGEYAPEKHADTDTAGNDIKRTPTFQLNQLVINADLVIREQED